MAVIGQAALWQILAITTPIYLIIGLGFGAVRLAVVSEDGVKAMAAFLVNIAVPALLFRAISTGQLTKVISSGYLFAYGLGSLAAFLSVLAIAVLVLRQHVADGAIYAVGGSLSNTLMIGFPVATAVLGSAALAPFAMVLLVENIVILPLALILAEIGRARNGALANAFTRVARAVAGNPMIWAILAGATVSLTGVELPKLLNQSLSYLGQTVTGLGLFVVGGMLVGFGYRTHLDQIALVLTGKLLLHPAAVIGMMALVPGISRELVLAGAVFAAAPMFGVYSAIGQRYGMGQACAAAQATATILSYASISLIVLVAASLLSG